MEDYYSLLEITVDASFNEVKLAYRKKIRQYHPDTNKSKDAEKVAKSLNKAYSILSDPSKRQAYDLQLSLSRSASSVNVGGVTWTSTPSNTSQVRVVRRVRIQTQDGYFDIEFRS